MENLQFISMAQFSEQIKEDPLQFVIEGDGLRSLRQMMVEAKTNDVKRFVKVEAGSVSFCLSLAFDFLVKYNPELCQSAFRSLGFDWVTTSKI